MSAGGIDFHSLRFGRAAASYQAFSEVQEKMGRDLLRAFDGNPMNPEALALGAGPRELADRSAPSAPGRILEMGCGTGQFTRQLRARFPEAMLLATDSSPRMLEEAGKNLGGTGSGFIGLVRFDAAGLEPAVPEIVLSKAPFQLAASNAMVQWFTELAAHFRMVAALLAPGGTYLVTGFLRDNFPELNGILAAEPFGYQDFPGHTPDQVLATAESAFVVDALWTEDVERVYPDALDFLAVIKGLGSARRPREAGPMTRARLETLINRYHQGYTVSGGVKATWKPWYALLRKA